MQQDHWASLFPVDEDAKWPPQSEYDTEFIDFPDDKGSVHSAGVT